MFRLDDSALTVKNSFLHGFFFLFYNSYVRGLQYSVQAYLRDIGRSVPDDCHKVKSEYCNKVSQVNFLASHFIYVMFTLYYSIMYYV